MACYIDSFTASEIRSTIKRGESITRYDWASHNYQYYLGRSAMAPTSHLDEIWPYHYVDGWWITAGCRRWSSVKSMRRHYRDSSWHAGEYRSRRERFRKESLVIANKIAAFAREHKLKFAVEKARKRDLRNG